MASETVESASFYKLWSWFEQNKKPVAWGAAILLVGGLLTWFVLWQRNEKETAASEAVSKVFTAQLLTAGPHQGNPEAYLKVVSEYPKATATARALLLAAGDLFVQGKFGQAYTEFVKFTREHRDSPLMGQALLGVASCLEAQAKTNEAVTAYKDLIEHHPTESVVPHAKFALAGLYQAQNKPEQAFTLLEDVSRADSYGTLGSEAAMRLEELKLQHPNLAPPPPASNALLTNIPMLSTSAPPRPSAATSSPTLVPSNATPSAAPKP